MNRCDWVTDDLLYIQYHDFEWGRPVFDDQKLFEMLTLEGAQAGLNWLTILKRRENYRVAFDHFDVQKIAHYGEEKVQELLGNEGIIRNERKIRSTIRNAQAFIEIKKKYGSFSTFLWGFVDGQPIKNHWKTSADVPSQTELSRKISKELKRHGFSFVGPTIVYAYMQAVGIVNDHIQSCFCYEGKN
ncbi:DNA-3-methyladenine glycosylase I [Caldifermentibacillus hisashii]|uniref:DNA-3-methyladenine glycosylase I n=1 Tax=Caldifermentibacillus hisashii TaxID=996558 RepID=UPI0031017504